MRRREFIAGLGSAAAWPFVAGAQEGDRVPRVGVLLPWNENDSIAKASLSAFVQGLEALGWSEGRNLRMDRRWAGGDLELARLNARELIARQPDVIFVDSTAQTAALQRETRTLPIVFVEVTEPIGSGLVAALNQPGGNITGFAGFEGTLGGKWPELLSEIAPGLKRAAIMFNPDTAPASAFMPTFETRPGHSRSRQSLRPFIAT